MLLLRLTSRNTVDGDTSVLTFAGVLVFLSVDLDEKRCRAGGFDRRK